MKKSTTIAILFLLASACFFSTNSTAQQRDVMNQNISVYAEDESLADVIEKICGYLNLNYSYNSKLLTDKRISLNVSNKPLKEILDKLMRDYYLIFEIENNILVVRDYEPVKKSVNVDKKGNFIAPNEGFSFNDSRGKHRIIEFKSASNLIILPVRINESDTLNFILDTGVRIPIITELPYVSKLNLNLLRPVDVRGLGDGIALTAYRSAGNQISIDGLSAMNQDVQMIISEDFQVSQILGIPVHGVMGFNAFRNHVVKIDYINEKLTIYDPKHFKYRKRNKDIILPFSLEKGKPYVRISVVQEDLSEIPVKVLIDTGASDALWLSVDSNERLKLPSKIIHTFLGSGLSGDLYGNKGRIAGVNIGSIAIFEPIVSFPDSASTPSAVLSNERNGTLGAEILRRFVVFFDYQKQRVILRPTFKIKEKFNYNMSGMEVINPMPGFPIFTVDQVREGSPAFEAGICKNDQILMLNGKNHKSISLNEINEILQRKDNTRVKITVLRNDERIKTSFYLQKEL